MKTSSIASGATPARVSAARAARAPSSAGCVSRKRAAVPADRRARGADDNDFEGKTSTK